MTFYLTLNNSLETLHLLKHPFYRAWNEGMLTREILKIYAKEYYHHVAAFPRYISQIHTLCSNIQVRQVLLGNLIGEEQGEDNHPELWLRFAEGLGISRDEIQHSDLSSFSLELVEGYFQLLKTDYATGLGALYAYERQTPEISQSKIDGLKQHYSIHDERTLQFFSVHKEVDEWYTEELVSIIECLDKNNQQKVSQGATKGAQLLWSFLDGMMSYCNC